MVTAMPPIWRSNLCIALLGAACGCVSTHASRSHGGPIPGDLVIAPTLVLNEHVDTPTEEDWTEGLLVGNLVMSGGYITVQRDGGMQNRSTEGWVERTDMYRQQIISNVDRCVDRVLDASRIVTLGPGSLKPPARSNHSGMTERDGRDNQPLPRFQLVPSRLEEPPLLPDGADAVFVPWVVHYYSHNGGWFLGQTYGSSAGARARLLWVVYDRAGEVLAHGESEAWNLDNHTYSPNSAKVEDYLTTVEEDLCQSLTRTLRRARR